ncbi:hypothetical protein B4065_3330 [Caldibacillus thermoamylovorans]|uniref:hypothetical protein n=1 Tax=Caldibacillus thermoamylovorans TaxID=35841 RepID=UPI0005A49C9D|nr:hypothetical protein [Caldibacillus thermoamylovorans]KIO62110.1 hypothetical protein B4065_3330 [Caldibacillus thermoamylovorans]
MTDKERLENIKEQYQWAIEHSLANRIDDSDIEWLIQQAKRVQELEEQNQRYREALEEIRCLYPLRNVGYQVSEIKKIVIKALEGKE